MAFAFIFYAFGQFWNIFNNNKKDFEGAIVQKSMFLKSTVKLCFENIGSLSCTVYGVYVVTAQF